MLTPESSEVTVHFTASCTQFNQLKYQTFTYDHTKLAVN